METILESVAKTGRLVIVDTAHRTCSAASGDRRDGRRGGLRHRCKKPIVRLATPDVHIPFSPALEKPLYPSKDRIVAAVRALL